MSLAVHPRWLGKHIAMTTTHTIEVPRAPPTRRSYGENGFILALVAALLVLVRAAIAFTPANPDTINSDAQWIVGP
jgi:hypothetical protein